MPTDDPPIHVWNDADDVTAVRAPTPGLIRQSKMFAPPPEAIQPPSVAPPAPAQPKASPPPPRSRPADPTSPWSPSRRTPPAGLAPLAVARAPAPPPRLEPTQPWPSPGPPAGPRSRASSVPEGAAPFGPPAVPVVRADSPAVTPRARRAGIYTAVVVVAAAAGMTGWWQWSVSRPGKVEISTSPADAVIVVGGQRVGGASPVTLERPPGTYAVAVTRDGYVRVQQNIEVRAGQVVVLPITLAPAAETGVEIAGDPPGVPVWLDGVRLAGTGQPSRTGARTYPVQAGKHLLELRGDPKFKPWRESFEIEKGSVRSFHVQLAPVESAEPSHRISTGVVTAPSRWRTAHAALKIENSDETVALMANANPATAAPPGATGTATRPPLPTPLPAAGTEDEPRPDDVPASAEADPAPPPGGAAPRTVPDRLARAQLLIDPNAEEYRVTLPPPLAQAGKKLTAVVRVCVSALGAVSEVQILKSADAAVDPDIRTVIGKWRYQPLMIDGRAAPFCTVLNHDVSPP